MDKKGIIAITLSIAVLIWWQIDTTKKYQEAARNSAQTPAAATATPAAETTPTGSPAIPSTTAASSPQTAAVPTETVPEETRKISTPAVDYTFTNLGGGIQRAELLKHMAVNGSHVIMNQHGQLPIGATTTVPLEGVNAPYQQVPGGEGEIIYERTTGDVQMLKKFILPKASGQDEEFVVKLEVSFVNRGQQPSQVPGYYLYTGSAAPIHDADMPIYTRFDWYQNGDTERIDVNWFDAGKIPLIGIQTRPERAIYSESKPDIAWAGVVNQYFTSIISATSTKGTSVWARRFPVKSGEEPLMGIDGAMGMPGFALKPGETATHQFQLFIGPKEYKRLSHLGNNEDEIMNFGMFKIVSKFLLNSMNVLNSWFHSYAAAIIVLTLIIKTLLWYPQNKATNSMKKMQALQPKMTELREKYKDDPARMNQELMKLYKDFGVNPFGGCIPMLFQIPIFFGFYSMLGTAVELRNSQFLWVNDLSQPDTVFHLAGIPVNILPLLMAGTMFWQMAITPKSGDPVQQRVFMFVPLIFIFFCYNFASALALYWTVQNIFSIFQLYITRNQELPVLVKTTAPQKKGRRK